MKRVVLWFMLCVVAILPMTGFGVTEKGLFQTEEVEEGDLLTEREEGGLAPFRRVKEIAKKVWSGGSRKEKEQENVKVCDAWIQAEKRQPDDVLLKLTGHLFQELYYAAERRKVSVPCLGMIADFGEKTLRMFQRTMYGEDVVCEWDMTQAHGKATFGDVCDLNSLLAFSLASLSSLQEGDKRVWQRSGLYAPQPKAKLKEDRRQQEIVQEQYLCAHHQITWEGKEDVLCLLRVTLSIESTKVKLKFEAKQIKCSDQAKSKPKQQKLCGRLCELSRIASQSEWQPSEKGRNVRQLTEFFLSSPKECQDLYVGQAWESVFQKPTMPCRSEEIAKVNPDEKKKFDSEFAGELFSKVIRFYTKKLAKNKGHYPFAFIGSRESHGGTSQCIMLGTGLLDGEDGLCVSHLSSEKDWVVDVSVVPHEEDPLNEMKKKLRRDDCVRRWVEEVLCGQLAE